MALGGVGSSTGTQAIQTTHNEGVQQVQGNFNGHTVEVGEAQPRATSALKTAWMEVKHFFSSLFGVRVSTPDVDQIDSPDDAAKSLLHELTRSSPSELLILNALGHVVEQNPPGDEDESRQGFDQNMHDLFRQNLDGLSDMQLFRLHKNLERNPALLGNLPGLGQGLVMELAGGDLELEDPQALMRGAGKINDMGGALRALYEEVSTKLGDRGYKMGEIDTVMTQPSRTMDLVARKAIENGGDITRAVLDTHQQIQNERQQQRMDAIRQIQPQDMNEVQVEEHHEVEHHDNPLSDRAREASTDPRLKQIAPGSQGSCNPEALRSFFSDYFDVCSSPQFWSNAHARMNRESFGAALSLTVLERIQEQGEVRPQDLEDLHRALGPYDGIEGPPVAPFDQDLVGPLTSEKLSTLSQPVFERYFERGAFLQLNMEGSDHEESVRSTFANPEASGQQRLESLFDALEKTLATQYFAPSNISGPISGVI